MSEDTTNQDGISVANDETDTGISSTNAEFDGPTINDADGNPVPLTETREPSWQEKELAAQQEITNAQIAQRLNDEKEWDGDEDGTPDE